MDKLFIYDALDYSLVLETTKRTILKRELGVILNSNKIKLLKEGHPVMILSGSNTTKRPLFIGSSELSEEIIEGMFVKYQLDKFYLKEEDKVEEV
ncbi:MULTISPECIES: hypothetical protein [Flammeovirga]|uniref:Uncharacterized protein n=1 Tax=Flammeovirga agarivorans TaxID=2726742 RepID=A0A7X8XYB2_9BACT|nr:MULTISPECIES: hypothetical protein [Flammeovirga]NLR93890.1 hypothetical protein [Flammeovirga agarivorans]